MIEKSQDDLFQSTRQLEEFGDYINYIDAPYKPSNLIKWVEESDILKPLINAIASNVCLLGHGIRYKKEFDYNKASDTEKKIAEEEWTKLEELYKYINPTLPFTRVLYKAIYDKESIGYGMIEVLRDLTGKISGIEYARACNFRLVKQETKDRITTSIQKRLNSDGQLIEVEVPIKFKKFVQIIDGQSVYFKEFGDSRLMNYKTGEYSENVPVDERATEIIYMANHCSYSDYGVPRWIGNAPNILGNRKSELLNLKFFTDGKILPFAILVNGGELTEESVEAIRTGKGVDNAYKALLLEAVPDESTNGMNQDKQKVDIRIEKLTDTSLKDGLFMEYQQANRNKVRGDFRIPPIYLGDSTDYTKATADTSRLIAEEQVFIPEREDIANIFNSVINNEMEIKYCEMYLKGPETGNISEVSAALAPFIQAGTVTPNMLIDTLGKLLGKDIEELDETIGNVPIELLKLKMYQEPNIQKSDTDALSEISHLISEYLGDADEKG